MIESSETVDEYSRLSSVSEQWAGLEQIVVQSVDYTTLLVTVKWVNAFDGELIFR